MSMRPEWEDAIRCGRKTVDARLVADDIADVKVGQIIRYPGARVRVRHMRFYPGLADLLAHEDWRRIAPDATSPEDIRRLLELVVHTDTQCAKRRRVGGEDAPQKGTGADCR